jgi:hypothetical protein
VNGKEERGLERQLVGVGTGKAEGRGGYAKGVHHSAT